MKQILNIGTPVNTEGNLLDKDTIIDQVTKGEVEKREWKEFEIRVIPFCTYEEWAELSSPGEEYKKEQFLNSLKEPLEVLKFKIVDNEN